MRLQLFSWSEHVSEGFNILGLLSVSLYLLSLFQPVVSNHDNFCFAVPFGEDNRKLKMNKNKLYPYARTIGWEGWSKLEAFKKGKIDYQNWKGIGFKDDMVAPGFTIELKGLTVYTGTDRTKLRHLKGWLMVSVKANEGNIGRFAITARGYRRTFAHPTGSTNTTPGAWFSGIGEFVSAPHCDDMEASYLVKIPYGSRQFMPCGGVPPMEPTMPNGFLYVAKPIDPLFGPTDISLSQVNLFFRYTQTVCNFYKKINFRVQGILLKDLGKKSAQKHAISETVFFHTYADELFGSADAMPVNSKIKGKGGCLPTEKGIEQYTGKDENGMPLHTYIHKVESVAVPNVDCEDDYTCTTPYSSIHPLKYTNNDRLFVGRCKIDDIKSIRNGDSTDSENTPHICGDPMELDSDTYDKLDTFEKLLTNITDTIQARCTKAAGTNDSIPCPVLPARPHTTQATTTTQRTIIVTPTVGQIKIGIPIIEGVTSDAWDTRIVHGIFMTILTVFVLPVDILTTRYFKETKMTNRVLMHHWWYFLHHFWIAMSFVLTFVGMFRMIYHRGIFGRSMDASANSHKLLGWFSIIISILMVIFGGWRPMGRIPRYFVIAFHCSLGLLIYILNLSELINSSKIPGSPTRDTNNVMNKAFHLITFLVIARIVIDVIFHLALSIQLMQTDKHVRVFRKRFYFPSPIPVISDASPIDMPGTQIRVILLIIYIVLSLILTVVIIVLLIFKKIPEGAGLGPMTCSHFSTLEMRNEFGQCP